MEETSYQLDKMKSYASRSSDLNAVRGRQQNTPLGGGELKIIISQ